jgi:hypothetical protein
MKLICKIFGHRILVLPFLPHSHQDFYDTVCTRCGGFDTIFAGKGKK